MKRLFFAIMMSSLVVLFAGCGQSPQQPVAVKGQPAPQFTLVDTKGKTWNLAELRGKVVFVNFWATWCPPCREEMPSMQAVHASMPDESFVMLSILSNDDPAQATAMAERTGLTFPILIDPESKVGQAYGLTGLPETYIIDKQGVLREKFIGGVQWDSAEALQMLMKYIAQ